MDRVPVRRIRWHTLLRRKHCSRCTLTALPLDVHRNSAGGCCGQGSTTNPAPWGLAQQRENGRPPRYLSCSGVTDAIYTLTFNFLGGPAPAAPFPDCDTADRKTNVTLGCDAGYRADPKCEQESPPFGEKMSNAPGSSPPPMESQRAVLRLMRVRDSRGVPVAPSNVEPQAQATTRHSSPTYA